MRPRHAESFAQGALARAAALVVGLSAFCGSAAAQTPRELERAREEFRQALALQTAGDCAAALVKFQSVGRVKMTPHVQFNIALCEERLGHLVAALGHYRLAQSDAESVQLEDVAGPAKEAIDALEARIPRLIVRRGPGAEGALIEIDGAPIGDAMIGSAVLRDPGSHVVTARFGERRVFEQAFDLPEGGEHEVLVTAERESPGPPEKAPTRVGAAPAEAEPPPSSSTRRTLGYVAGGIGLASLATAGVFVFLRQGVINDLEDRCNGHACPPDAQSAIDRGRLYTGIAEGGVLLGVAGVAVGAVLLLGGNDEPRAAHHERFVSLRFGGPGTVAGAHLDGRF